MVTVLTDAGHAGGDPVYFVVPRPRAYLADLLAMAFQGREDVEIIVDRRFGERRTGEGPGAVRWRQAERRRPKEDMIEVVIEVSRPGGPGENSA